MNSFEKKRVFCFTEHVEGLEFIGKMDDVEEDVFTGSLAICCDTATRERIADKRYKLCKEIIKVDHHIIIDNYGDYNIVDEDIPAASLIIARFLFKYPEKLKITLPGANALYTGIITDTSNFRYRGVNFETFYLAGKLIELGVEVSNINKSLASESLRATRLKAFVYNSLKVSKNGVVYAKLKKKTLKSYNVSYEEAASLVNLLGNIKECPIWILFIGYPDEIRIRIRSNGPDINKIAEAYGGGGHQKAAGASIKHWSAAKKVVKDADEMAKCYKENIPFNLERK